MTARIIQPGERIEKIEGWGMGPLPGLMNSKESEYESGVGNRAAPNYTLTPFKEDTLYWVWTNNNPNNWVIFYLLRRANGEHRVLVRTKEAFEHDDIRVVRQGGENVPNAARKIIANILSSI